MNRMVLAVLNIVDIRPASETSFGFYGFNCVEIKFAATEIVFISCNIRDRSSFLSVLNLSVEIHTHFQSQKLRMDHLESHVWPRHFG